jgi:hypothetical protein
MGDWDRHVGNGGEIPEWWDLDRLPKEIFDRPKGDHVTASRNTSRQFSTIQEALDWAKNNPGKVISRSPDGEGFVGK